MVMGRLDSRRILIVGASSGLGRAIALVLAREGAQVAAAARRRERLDELAAESPSQIIALGCDVADEASCVAAVAAAARDLDGLDALVYSAGVAPLVGLADADQARWREILDVNLIGASLVTRAALPHLRASRGRALYLSSVAGGGPPRRGLALYGVSKTALDHSIACWQEEEREVAFTRISVGDTMGTEMAAEWGEAAGDFVGEWVARGFLYGRTMEPEDVAEHVVGVLASAESVPFTSIVPRFPVD